MQMNGPAAANSSRRSMAVGLVGALLAAMLVTGLTTAASVTITIEHYIFSPSPLNIATGTTVTWISKDPTVHQVVSDTGAFPKSKLLNAGDKYSVTFTKAGTYAYHDGFGTTLRGTIVVTGPPKATPKPTVKPAPNPTPRPTVKPTAKPTTVPTAAATPIAEATPAATAEPGTASPGPDATGSRDARGRPDRGAQRIRHRIRIERDLVRRPAAS